MTVLNGIPSDDAFDPVDSGASPAEELSTSIIFSVAEAAGVDPMDVSPVLYDAVDPDALNRLFDGAADLRVEFSVGEYRVVVDGADDITVVEQ